VAEPDASRGLAGAELSAWRSFLGAHAAITRALDAELEAAHGLTLSEYEVLLRLAQADGRRLRMSELADRVLLTRSRITRLVDGLEAAGLVRRATCPSDARGLFAELTGAGASRLAAAGGTHVAGVRERFSGRFGEAELDELARQLRRLAPGADDGGCAA